MSNFEAEAKALLNRTNTVVEGIKEKPYNPQEAKDKGRNFLTYAFICGYFIVFIVCFIYVGFYNRFLINNGCDEYLIDITDMILKVGGLLGTSLGFVLGYYFKTSENDNKKELKK